MKRLLLIFFLLGIFWHCQNLPSQDQGPVPSQLSGVELSKMYCGSCHQMVEPNALPQRIWAEDVLPAMGYRLGLGITESIRDSLLGLQPGQTLANAAEIYPLTPRLALEDWEKIVDHYLANAPDTISYSSDEGRRIPGLTGFQVKEVEVLDRPTLINLVKILPDAQGIVYNNAKKGNNRLQFLQPNLHQDFYLRFATSPVDVFKVGDSLCVTTVGKSIFPHDTAEGDIQWVYKKSGSQTYNASQNFISNLNRPVSVQCADLDEDGLADYLVCEFGNNIGRLAWYKQIEAQTFERQILFDRPGAIATQIVDMDGDGDKDIMALFAQGDEAIYFLENQGSGKYHAQKVLTFSPLNGSQYMTVADFNHDGHMDILYVCGDNADKTPILKSYHGVYIYLNKGDQSFKEAYFYPLDGAYKAVPADFDQDGDLDIAAISFFPDYAHHPEQSFVYLENHGNLLFQPTTFADAQRGRWMVMDVGDIEGDGDLDIALGSFVYFTPQGDTTGLGEKWLKESPSVLILENQRAHP